jgi:hypothetical protein
MVEALAAQTAQKSFAVSIRGGCSEGRYSNQMEFSASTGYAKYPSQGKSASSLIIPASLVPQARI